MNDQDQETCLNASSNSTEHANVSSLLLPADVKMMTQRRAEQVYQDELTKYNEDNSMLMHAAQNERRWDL